MVGRMDVMIESFYEESHSLVYTPWYTWNQGFKVSCFFSSSSTCAPSDFCCATCSELGVLDISHIVRFAGVSALDMLDHSVLSVPYLLPHDQNERKKQRHQGSYE